MILKRRNVEPVLRGAVIHEWELYAALRVMPVQHSDTVQLLLFAESPGLSGDDELQEAHRTLCRRDSANTQEMTVNASQRRIFV